MQIGKAIKTVRVQRDLTQQQLASSVGCSVAYICGLERGNRTNPGIQMLQRISDQLDMPLMLLTFLAEEDHEQWGLDSDLINRLSFAMLDSLQKSEIENERA